MDWNDVWKIVLCAVGGAGGIGAIIVGAVKYSSDMIADRLSQKYEAKLQKDLEHYKANLDNKIYITKAKFDAEFALYRDLTSKFFDMVKAVTTMIPAGYAEYPADKADREKYEDELYNRARKTTVVAQDTLNANIPFIPETLYEKYEEILGLSRGQLGVFELRWNVGYLATEEEKKKFSHEDYQRSRDILTKLSNLNKDLSTYLSKLDVLE